MVVVVVMARQMPLNSLCHLEIQLPSLWMLTLSLENQEKGTATLSLFVGTLVSWYIPHNYM